MITFKNVQTSVLQSTSHGLKRLELLFDLDTYVYILRSLYRLVFTSKQLKENKKQLQDRIKQFEVQSNIPCFLSTMPIEQLLTQLEDAQYFYPIRRREITLPTFH